MLSRLGLRNFFSFLFRIDHHERLKFIYLTISFFFVIGGYTIIRELKDSIFMSIVGPEYINIAKFLTFIILIPAILFYSFLVDKIRRYQLLIFYSLLYGILSLIFLYFIGHPEIGILNTNASPFRLFGWIFYFFVEGFSPFVVSVFWAFANSITSPEAAKKDYALMVSGSKIGGMATSAFAWYLLGYSNISFSLSSVAKHQLLLGITTVCLLCVPIFIFLLIKKVPGKYLHGYEAVYKVEKEKEKEEKEPIKLLSGLKMLVKQPYVLGIFSMVFFYEVLSAVLGYQRLLFAKKACVEISDLSCILFGQIFMVHLIGFFISLLGTNILLRWLGERRCLLLIPVIVAILLTIFSLHTNVGIAAAIWIGLKALNYAVIYPIRESLYIPTIKEIKFKSKSWIDSFGSKFAKVFGYGFNTIAIFTFKNFGLGAFNFIHNIFFSVIVSSWFIVSYLLGKRYQKAIIKGEAIGFSDN